MSPLLKSMYGTEGGSEALDVLMKYMYVRMPPRNWDIELGSTNARVSSNKGMAMGAPSSSKTGTPAKMTPQSTGFSQIGGRPGVGNESSQAAMSVLLSWHEKVVEVAGLGSIGRVMTDWRRV